MKMRTKVGLGLLIILLLFLASLTGIILYYYHHPSEIKSLVEKTISRSTGTSLTIKTLSYALKPLSFSAEEIMLEPDGGPGGFLMEIPALKADLSLKGPFGRRTLIFENLSVDGFSLHLSKGVRLPKMEQEEKRPSFLARILRSAVAVLLFRDMQFEAATLVRGEMRAQLKNQILKVDAITADLSPDHLIEISCSAEMHWPSQKMTLFAPHLRIATDHKVSFVEPQIKGTMTARKATLLSPNADVKEMEAKAQLTYSHKEKTLTFAPLDFRFEGVNIRPKQDPELRPLSVQVKSEGVFDIRERELKASHLHLGLKDRLNLKGNFRLGLKDKVPFKLQILEGHFMPQELFALLPGELKAKMAPITLSGPAKVRGHMEGLREKEKWHLQSDLQVMLEDNQLSYEKGEIQLKSKVTGNIWAKGALPHPNISVRLNAEETRLSGTGIKLEPYSIGIHLSGEHPLYSLKDLTIHVPKAELPIARRDILVRDINILGRKGRLNGDTRTLDLPDLKLDTSLLRNLRASLKLDGEQVVLALWGEDIHLIQSAIGLKFLPPGWQVDGVDAVQVNATLKRQGGLTFTSRVEIQDLGFQNEDASYAGEKISLDVATEGELSWKDSHFAAKAKLKAETGEILYDRFYLDLGSNAFSSSLEGRYDLSKNLLQVSGLGLELKDILNLTIKGKYLREASNPLTQLSVNIPKTPLNPIFHHFIREPFKTEKPFLGSINLGGVISADLELRGAGPDWMVRGHYRWDEGELSSVEKGFSFFGINLDLPVWYQAQNSKREQGSITGGLAIQSFTLPLLPSQPLQLPLVASPNVLSVRSPTTLKVPGGVIQLGPVVCRDVFQRRPSLDTSLTLHAVNLDPTLSKFWPRPVEGAIGGRLDPIHLEGGRLSTQGVLKAEIFGGEIILSDLSGTGIFTAAPVFRVDARFNALNLADLTTDTPFGKIEGILEGHVKGLDVAYGQPQRFDLLFETVKKKGIPQKISVKAVDNIARIGGGQSPFMGFTGLITSFFKEFPYDKIGIRASLENDLFRINGTIREEGVEYLVRRAGLSGVNIVNQNPDNRIRFKDMVKRIKRVTSPKSGPVVK